MASKKGVVITAIVLGAITAASFLVWTIPQEAAQTISVSDFEGHLDGVQSIHQVLSGELDASFERLQAGEITARQYVEMAEATSTQINSQIIQLVESGASEEWHESYISYMDALKTQNSIIRETIVVANAAEETGQRGLEESLARIEELRGDMQSLIEASVKSHP